MGTARRVGARRRRRAIAIDDRDFIRGAAAWSEKTDHAAIDLGLSRDDARRRAAELIQSLRSGQVPNADAPLTDADIDVLEAACELLTEWFAGVPSELRDKDVGPYDVVSSMPPQGPSFDQAGTLADSVVVEPIPLLDDARRLYDFVSTAHWPDPDFGERDALLCDCALLGWRGARLGTPATAEDWLRRINEVSSPASAMRSRVKALATLTASARLEAAKALGLEHPATILQILSDTRCVRESDPHTALQEVTAVYLYLADATGGLAELLPGEREYFMGETALVAGTACRVLARRMEASSWFDLAEAWFQRSASAIGNLLRLAYQRLALKLEERDFRGVSELSPSLVAAFHKQGMSEEALKARFLQAAVLKETGRTEEAVAAYREIASAAKAQGSQVLFGAATVNLVQSLGTLGRTEEALSHARMAEELFRHIGNRVDHAKLLLGIAYVMRFGADLSGTVSAFRAAQRELIEIGLHADAAAVRLCVADFLINAGHEREAELEIRQALPIIEEYKLAPEGFAALSLLRESLRRQKIDRNALRNLHEHFEQKKP